MQYFLLEISESLQLNFISVISIVKRRSSTLQWKFDFFAQKLMSLWVVKN